MERPSVQDVARRAGVGTSTVSRVLNNHPNISDHARERVMAAVRELGYAPNLNARSLRSGQASAVSVLLPMTVTAFYTELLSGAEGVLDRADLDTALFPLVSGIRIKRYRRPDALLYRADGLIIASLDVERVYEGPDVPFGGPVILVDAHHPRYHSVYFDNLAAGRLAAEHVLASGRPTTIALIDVAESPGAFESPVFEERRRGLLGALAAQGVRPLQTVQVPISPEDGRQAARQLLEGGLPEHSLVIALCDELALGAERHFADAGIQVGLMGFDGSPQARARGLTTIEQPTRRMGEVAAELLLSALNGELSSIQSHQFAPVLVEGPSTARLPT